LAQPPSGPGAAAGQSTTAAQVAQALTLVVSVAVVIGAVYMVLALASGGGVSAVHTFLAYLSVIGVVAGILAGYIAEYRLVTGIVQSLGSVGTSIVALVTFLSPDSSGRDVSFGVSVVAGLASAMPRIAEAASAAAMLGVSLFVFEATRRGYLLGVAFVAAPAFMTAAAFLLGNALAEAFAPPQPTEGVDQ
jgi:hypothetical protein